MSRNRRATTLGAISVPADKVRKQANSKTRAPKVTQVANSQNPAIIHCDIM
jgi:hypothetical protein